MTLLRIRRTLAVSLAYALRNRVTAADRRAKRNTERVLEASQSIIAVWLEAKAKPRGERLRNRSIA